MRMLCDLNACWTLRSTVNFSSVGWPWDSALPTSSQVNAVAASPWTTLGLARYYTFYHNEKIMQLLGSALKLWQEHIPSRSVQFSSVMSNSLWSHELQHARPPCPSPDPRVHSDSCPSSQWYYPAISSSVVPFSCPQSLPASQPFPVSQLFTWGGQSIGVSASVHSMNTQDWSPLGWTGWTSLQSKGLSRVFSNTIVQKHQFFSTHLSL